jgi:hypothetical protein
LAASAALERLTTGFAQNVDQADQVIRQVTRRGSVQNSPDTARLGLAGGGDVQRFGHFILQDQKADALP